MIALWPDAIPYVYHYHLPGIEGRCQVATWGFSAVLVFVVGLRSPAFRTFAVVSRLSVSLRHGQIFILIRVPRQRSHLNRGGTCPLRRRAFTPPSNNKTPWPWPGGRSGIAMAQCPRPADLERVLWQLWHLALAVVVGAGCTSACFLHAYENLLMCQSSHQATTGTGGPQNNLLNRYCLKCYCSMYSSNLPFHSGCQRDKGGRS